MDRLVWRALTLQERLDVSFPPSAVGLFPISPVMLDQIEIWKQWFGATNRGHSRWNAFLGELGLTETSFARIASSDENLIIRPPWADRLKELFAALAQERARAEPGDSAEEPLAHPVVRSAWQELVALLPPRQLELLSRRAAEQLHDSLLHRLARSVRQIAAWETYLQDDDWFLGNEIEAATARIFQSYAVLPVCGRSSQSIGLSTS